MLKLVFNEDFSHAVMSSSFSQSTVFQITNYSTRQVTMNFNIDATSISNLVAFEDTPITKLRVLDESGEVIMNLTLSVNNLYILSYNTNIYDGGQSTNVNIGQVVIPEQNNEGEEE